MHPSQSAQSAQSPSFIHLNLHTEFSIQNGMLRIDEAIQAAKMHGMPALAITDLNNGFAWLKFYQAARKQGIKPILGADVVLENQQIITFLIQNHRGYLNLSALLSALWCGNQSFLPLSAFTPENTSDLIVIVGKESELMRAASKHQQSAETQQHITSQIHFFNQFFKN